MGGGACNHRNTYNSMVTVQHICLTWTWEANDIVMPFSRTRCGDKLLTIPAFTTVPPLSCAQSLHTSYSPYALHEKNSCSTIPHCLQVKNTYHAINGMLHVHRLHIGGLELFCNDCVALRMSCVKRVAWLWQGKQESASSDPMCHTCTVPVVPSPAFCTVPSNSHPTSGRHLSDGGHQNNTNLQRSNDSCPWSNYGDADMVLPST